jgi:hypothetical protein
MRRVQSASIRHPMNGVVEAAAGAATDGHPVTVDFAIVV